MPKSPKTFLIRREAAEEAHICEGMTTNETELCALPFLCSFSLTCQVWLDWVRFPPAVSNPRVMFAFRVEPRAWTKTPGAIENRAPTLFAWSSQR